MQDDPDQARGARAVRSYVLRAGRMTAAQQRALQEWWPRYGVPYQPRALDLAALFGRQAPVTLEIGFGNGEHLLSRARGEPERNFIGVEVHRPGIGHLLLELAAADVHNVRIVEHDAVDLLEVALAPGCLDEIQILFPDPWPKKRHHKRRLVQPAFVGLVASRLRIGGRLHIATDWAPYADHIRSVLSECSALQPLPALHAPLPRAPTRFERRGERLGHRVEEWWLTRREPIPTEQ